MISSIGLEKKFEESNLQFRVSTLSDVIVVARAGLRFLGEIFPFLCALAGRPKDSLSSLI